MNQHQARPNIYQLRIVLRDMSPLIWRRLLVRSDTTLAPLHLMLQLLFDWSNEHLHHFHHCPCQPHETESFSPLAVLLPERTTLELLYLETKWASLSSYGTSVKLLQDVLPCDEPLEAVTIRNHVCTLAERLENELGDEQVSFIAGCPREWGDLPTPDAVLGHQDTMTRPRASRALGDGA